MYLVRGLGNTVLITVFALLIGVGLGAIIALIRVNYIQAKKKSPLLVIANFLSGLYLTVIRGTPMVVQLMIMYFVKAAKDGVFSRNKVKTAGNIVFAVFGCIMQMFFWQGS